jgi:WD40 repeat protein
MRSSFLKPWVLRMAALLAASPILLAWAEEDPERDRCEILLERLMGRVKDASGEREKLREEVLALRNRSPGTATSLKASVLLRQLPSALDRLDPRSIPDLEKFSWQPKDLVAVLGEHRGRHGVAATCCAFSPVGNLIISGGGGYLRVWRPGDMRLLQVESFSLPSSMAFSKDGKMLAVAGVYANWTLYDVVAGEKPLQARFSLPNAGTAAYAIAFHPSGKTVALGCIDNDIRIYDINGKMAAAPRLVKGHEKGLRAIAYSPDGATLASASDDKTVRLWDAALPIPKEKAVLAGHPGPVTALAFSPNGATLAAGCEDGVIRLWTLPAPARGARERSSFGDPIKSGQVYQLSFSASGQTLAAACVDGTVRLWNVVPPRPRERSKLEGHLGPVTGVTYSPDEKMIATCGSDWTCRTWDVSGAVPKERFGPWSHTSNVYSSAFSPDCQTLVSGGLDRIVRLWDLNRPDPKPRESIRCDSIPICNVYSPDGSRLAVAGNNSTIRQWDAVTGKPLRHLLGLPHYPTSLIYTPDSKSLLSYGDKTAYLYDSQTGQEVRQFTGHTTPLLSVSLAPDGKKLLTSAGAHLIKHGQIVQINMVQQYTDTTVRLWDLEKGTELHVIKDHKLPVYRSFFSPDGKSIFSGAGTETSVVRREIADLNKPATPAYPGLAPIYTSFQYSPDGARLATLNLSTTLKILDVATGKTIWEYVSPELISDVTFASDSRHLALSMGPGLIYIIRLAPPEVK